MKQPPETIYLILGEDIDGQLGWLWCDDPAPTNDHDPDEAVRYVRADRYDAPTTGPGASTTACDDQWRPDDADGS